MSKRDLLEELSNDFPDRNIYNYDEHFRYQADRAMLMDEVLGGTFETFERDEKEVNFRFKITAGEKFHLEVLYLDSAWLKDFDYITEAFDCGEAAYRLLIVMPRVLDEGEILLKQEQGLLPDEDSYARHDHCLPNYGEDDQIELIRPAKFVLKGHYIRATVYLCSDGSYLVNVVHFTKEHGQRFVADRFYGDFDLARLIAEAYVKECDEAKYPSFNKAYKRVYARATH